MRGIVNGIQQNRDESLMKNLAAKETCVLAGRQNGDGRKVDNFRDREPRKEPKRSSSIGDISGERRKQ